MSHSFKKFAIMTS